MFHCDLQPIQDLYFPENDDHKSENEIEVNDVQMSPSD
jgi:hypothetical protein